MGDSGFSQQKSIPKELRDVVKRALDLGWTHKKNASGGHTLFSPGGAERFYVPITAKDPSTLARTFSRQIDKAFLVENGGPENGLSGEDLAHVIDDIHDRGGKINLGPSPTVECTLCRPAIEFSGWGAYAVHVNDLHPVESDVEAPPEGVQEGAGVIVPDPVVEAPVEVVLPRPRPGFHTAVKAIAEARENTASVKMHDMEAAMQETFRPWRAIKERNEIEGTVLTYASSVVLEVVVDDKVVTHKCAVCPYRNNNPKSVVSHHSRHVSTGEAKPAVESDYRTEPAEKYPLVISKGPYVHARDEQEEAMYAAVHGRHQTKTEADSTYARALVERLNAKGYAIRKKGEVGNSTDTDLLNQVRDLLGVNAADAAALAEAQMLKGLAETALAEKDAELSAVKSELTKKVGFIETLAGLAGQEVKQ